MVWAQENKVKDDHVICLMKNVYLKPMQCDHSGAESDDDLLNMVWLVHSLSDSAWATITEQSTHE